MLLKSGGIDIQHNVIQCTQINLLKGLCVAKWANCKIQFDSCKYPSPSSDTLYTYASQACHETLPKQRLHQSSSSSGHVGSACWRWTYPRVLMKPLVEPSAYMEQMSPMCRKLDILSDMSHTLAYTWRREARSMFQHAEKNMWKKSVKWLFYCRCLQLNCVRASLQTHLAQL